MNFFNAKDLAFLRNVIQLLKTIPPKAFVAPIAGGSTCVFDLGGILYFKGQIGIGASNAQGAVECRSKNNGTVLVSQAALVEAYNLTCAVYKAHKPQSWDIQSAINLHDELERLRETGMLQSSDGLVMIEELMRYILIRSSGAKITNKWFTNGLQK